jgi:hypothetical protein
MFWGLPKPLIRNDKSYRKLPGLLVLGQALERDMDTQ